MKSHPGFEKYLARVGVTPKARLEWVFRMLNQYRRQQGEDWLPGDWDNASRELAVFAGIGDTLHGWGGVALEDGEIVERPDPNEVKAILCDFHQLVEDAEHHRAISLTPFPMKQTITWEATAGRYRLHESWDDLDHATWLDRARYALAHLLKDEGHRIQHCPAKLAHEGKRCGAFFLKSKRQKYCGKTCTSREMTRAKRGRDAHPTPTRKKKGATHGTKGR